MYADDRRKVSLVLGSDPTKDRDAVGEYTELVYEYTSMELLKSDEPKIDLELFLLRPTSPKEWWNGLAGVFKRCDLVHIEYPFEGWGTSIAPGLLPTLIKTIPRYRRTKIVTTLHEWRTMHPLRKASILPLALFSDGLLFVSQHEHHAYHAGLGRYSPRDQKTRVIPIGINVALPELSDGEILQERERLLNWNGIPVDLLLGYFGFVYSAKQPHKALSVLEKLLERGVRARLVFAGDFPADHAKERSDFFQRVQSSGLRDHVAFLGFVEEAILTRVLSACNVILLLFTDGVSARRGSFWTVLELGVPLITTKPTFGQEFRGLLPETLPENLVLLDAAETDEGLVSAVRNFTDFRIPRRRSGISPHWKRIAEDHAAFYHEMLGA